MLTSVQKDYLDVETPLGDTSLERIIENTDLGGPIWTVEEDQCDLGGNYLLSKKK